MIASSLYAAAVAALFLVFEPVAGVGNCGCSSCTSSVLNKDADGYSVRDRIDWVMTNMGQSEQDACSLVCGDEFPGVCGGECDPGQCGGGGGGGSRCGCSSCTTSVLGRDADGFPAGNRIDWVMANLGRSEEQACDLVCGVEYPDVCGECDCDSGGGGGPSPSPPPPSPPSGGGKCGCSSCTDSILSRDASGHSVGARIDWVDANMGMSEREACSLVCRDEFPGICGECDPSRCSSGPTSPTPPTPSPPPPSPPCANGQMRVINNCGGSTLRHCDGFNTKTIASGTCQDLRNGKRIWAGRSDSNCFSQGNSLFEFTYPAFPDGLAWDVSLLTGYNYPLQVKDGSNTLLNVSGPRCGGVREGLFPCTQPNGACVPGSDKWQPICAGCNNSCCDTTNANFDCNPPYRDNTSNLVLTFCPA